MYLAHEVHTPNTSQQCAGDTAPRYTLRRVNIPGPNTGFPYIVTWGPKTITATTAGQLVFQIPGGVRLLAGGWYSLNSGGASTFRVARSVTLGSAIAGTSSGVGVQPGGATGVLVSTDAAGVAYRGNTTSTYTVPVLTWAGGIDALGALSPEMPPFGSTTQRPFLEVRFATANTVTDFCCYLLLMPTTHPNTLKESD